MLSSSLSGEVYIKFLAWPYGSSISLVSIKTKVCDYYLLKEIAFVYMS